MIRSLACSALALMAGAAPVFAEVTPAQAWENLSKYYQDFGYEVATGNVEDAGNTLTVTDAVLSMAVEGSSTAITIPSMVFQETGDAKVRLTHEGDILFNSTVEVPAAPEPAEPTDPAAQPEGATPDAGTATTEPETEEMAFTGTISAPGNETLISGTPEDMLYEYNVPTTTYEFQIQTAPGSDQTVPFTGTLTDIKGTQRNVAGDNATSTFDLTAAEATLQSQAEVAETDAANTGNMNFNLTLTGIASAGEMTAPQGEFDLSTQLAQALEAGMTVDVTSSFDSIAADFDVATTNADDGSQQQASGNVALGKTDLSVNMSTEGLGYKAAAVDQTVNLTSSDLPTEISYSVAQASGELQVPVSADDQPQPFRFVYTLQDLTLADGIWALFDPNSQLPRDPADLTIDLQGDALVSKDLMDPAAMEPETNASGMPMGPEVPFQPKTLTINRFALDAIGATADLTGELAFGDKPQDPPVGQINGTFEGVNGLIDKFGAMGFIPQDQIMGVRMMLAMFAKPVEGQTDQMTTNIEFREGGSIFANGQQVK